MVNVGSTSTEVLEWDTIRRRYIIFYFNADDKIINIDTIYGEYKLLSL